MASNKRLNKETYADISSRIEDAFDFSFDLCDAETKTDKVKRSSKLTPYQEKMLEYFTEEEVSCVFTSDYIYQRPRKEELLKWQKMKTEEAR